MKNTLTAAAAIAAAVGGFYAFRSSPPPSMSGVIARPAMEVSAKPDIAAREVPPALVPDQAPGPPDRRPANWDDPNDPFGEYPSAFRKLLHAHASVDSLLEAILEITESEDREEMLGLFLGNLDPLDPTTLDIVTKIHARHGEGSGRLAQRFANIASSHASLHPHKTLDWAKRFPSGTTRDTMMAEIFEMTSAELPDRVFDHLDETGWRNASAVFNGALQSSLSSLVRLGRGRDAVAQISKWPAHSSLHVWFPEVWFDWLEADPEEALGFIDAAPSHEAARNAVASGLGRNAKEKPAEAFAQLSELKNPELRIAAAKGITSYLMTADLDLLLTWWDTLEPAESTGSQEVYLANAIKSYSEAGAALADRRPDLIGDPATYGKLVGRWMSSNPRGASEWVATLSPGENRDHAVEAIVDSLTWGNHRDPETARIWAETISNSERRTAAVETIESGVSLPADP